MGVMRISAHSLTSDVGIGSRPQDLDGEDFRILSRLSSDTGVKEDSIFLVELGLVTEDGVDDWSVDLILRILSEKTLQKVFARSVLFVQSGLYRWLKQRNVFQNYHFVSYQYVLLPSPCFCNR